MQVYVCARVYACACVWGFMRMQDDKRDRVELCAGASVFFLTAYGRLFVDIRQEERERETEVWRDINSRRYRQRE